VRAGIIALVDEARGYLRDRAKDALAANPEAFIAKGLRRGVPRNESGRPTAKHFREADAKLKLSKVEGALCICGYTDEIVIGLGRFHFKGGLQSSKIWRNHYTAFGVCK
jgi:hypothetical protein